MFRRCRWPAALLAIGTLLALPGRPGAQEAGFTVPNVPGYQARALWSEKRGWVLAFDQFDTPSAPRRIFTAHSPDGRRWSPPQRLAAGLASLTAPALAEGPGERLYLFAVAAPDGKTYAPYAWTSPDGRAWSEPTPLPLRTDGAPVLGIAAATTARGELLLAYQFNDPGNQNRATIAFARSTDGVKWTDPARVAFGDRRRPHLHVAPDGAVHLAYQGLAGTAFEIFTRRSGDFKTWGPEVQVSRDGNSHDAWLTAGRQGELVATYVSVREGKSSFDLQRAASKDRGATWTWERALCDTPEMEYAPAVAVGPAGARFLLFSRGNPAQGTNLVSMPFP